LRVPNGDISGAGGFSSYNSNKSEGGRIGTSGDIGGMGSAPSFRMNIPGAEQAVDQVNSLNSALGDLFNTVDNLGKNQARLSQNINSLMTNAGSSAQAAQRSFQPTGGQMGTASFASATGIPYATAAGGGSGDTFTNTITGAMSSSPLGNLGGTVETIAKFMATPIRYAYERIEENRMNTMGMAQALGPAATLTGRSIQGLINQFSNEIPVQGNINDILSAVGIGAATGYGTFDNQRSGSYYTAIREMQALTPYAPAGQLAAQYSGYLGNTQSQQRSMMLTGGAMSAFAGGGRPKTLAEWAEGLLRFFQNQRPGADRGKPFTKEQMEVQMFPGSNMDAWMNVNGVPDYMRNFFWQYALGKANAQGDTGGAAMPIAEIAGRRDGDLAYERLRLNSATARREFTLSGAEGLSFMPGNRTSYDAYMLREKTDTNFMSLLRYLDKTLGSMMGPWAEVIGNLATPIANIGANVLTESIPRVLGNLTGMIPLIGDTPGYGAYGGTNTSNLDPSLGRKIQAMMSANPNISISSGFRDGGLQSKLHAAGVGMVGPASESMHTRGWAADLGPESELGWIAANAHRFGLESGAHLGEPWHVGLPGTVPIGDTSEDWDDRDYLGSNPHGPPALPNPSDYQGRTYYGISEGPDHLVGYKSNLLGPLSGARNTPSFGPDHLTNYLPTLVGSTKDRQADEGQSLLDRAVSGFSDAVSGAIGGVTDALSSGLGSLLGMFAPITGILRFAGNAFGGITKAMSGDLSALFGEGGLIDVGSIGGKMAGGLFDLFGLPNFLDPEGSPGGALGFLQGGLLGPNQQSSVDWSQEPGDIFALGGTASSGAAGGAYTGGSTGPASLQSIFDKYHGGQSVGGTTLSDAQSQGVLSALTAAAGAGFKGDELITLAAIAGRESGWKADAHRSSQKPLWPNPSTPAMGDRGMWQINYVHDKNLVAAGIIPSATAEGRKALFNVDTNAKAAYLVAGGGDPAAIKHAWGANDAGWVGSSGRALHNAAKYVEPVYNIAKQHGFIGDPRRPGGQQIAPVTSVYSPSSAMTMTTMPITLQNTFNISSSGGDADARRVAAVIADHLDKQFATASSRSR
jgi:hypothetical protein